MIEIKAAKAKLTLLTSEPLTSGMVGAVQAAFLFSEDWEGLSRTAVFSAGSVSISAVLDENDCCIVPWECLTHSGKRLTVGVYGTEGEALILPTVTCDLGLILAGTSLGSGSSETVTPTLAEQVLAKASQAMTMANGVRADADAGLFKGEQGETGQKGDTGETGATGAKGDAFTYADFTTEQLEALRGPQGIKGDTGETGATGAKGDAFTYADFTTEQLEALRGPQGIKGDTGETGAAGADGAPGNSHLAAYTASDTVTDDDTKLVTGGAVVDYALPKSGGTLGGAIIGMASPNNGTAQFHNAVIVANGTDPATLSVPVGTLIFIEEATS